MHFLNLHSFRRHRHFLAVPVVASLLALTVVTTHGKLAGNILVTELPNELIATGGDQSFSFPSGLSGILREDAVFERDGNDLFLADGTALLSSPSLFGVRSGNLTFQGFRGAFVITIAGGKATVLALTAPVLVTAENFSFIIPAGMQHMVELAAPAADIASLQMIPEAVAREELLRAEQVPASELPLLAAPQPMPPAFLLPFVLPATEDRILESQKTSQIADLQAAMRSGERVAALSILKTRLDLTADMLPVLIAESAAMPSVAQELLAYVHDPALWLLVSFHPQYRLAAWQNDGAGMPLSARILRWLELPASDVLEPLPERVIDEWREQIQAYKGDSAFVESLLTAMEGFHRFAEQSQFPQRLRRYAEALQAIVKDPSDLSADAQAQLHLWTDVDAIPPYSEPEPLPVPEPVASCSA
jgi:hypothetical protein